MARARRIAVVCALSAVALLATAAAAPAVEPGFNHLEANPSDTLAGGHPNALLEMGVNVANMETEPCDPTAPDCLSARSFNVHWPTGFIGNPHVAPKCTLTEFVGAACPQDSQVGTVTSVLFEFEVMVPLYNMETRPDQAGALGFLLPAIGSPVILDLTSRTDGDYGLDAKSSPLLRGFSTIPQYNIEIWGVPASPNNTPFRFVTPLDGFGACFLGVFGPEIIGCPPELSFGSPTYASSTSPERPFLQNPTTCGVPLTLTAEIEYYGGAVGHGQTDWPPTTGCNQASFTPSITGNATTSQTDSPSGLDTVLRVPQTQSPDTPAPSELRTATIELPEGFTINPNAADGKVACPELLTGIGTLGPAACPEFSKVGSLVLDVAALPGPIPGALYIAEPTADDPYRVLLTASGFATHVKLLGSVRPDPQTGRVSIVFEDLPQSPLQEFSIHVFGAERGLFATPTHCGSYPMESEFVPWNSALETRRTSHMITLTSGPGGAPCPNGPRPHAPAMIAGSVNNTAGLHSPFSFRISRPDGDQFLSAIDVATPPGLTASLRGIPYCPESAIALLQSAGYDGRTEQASPACPAASEVGKVVSGVGAGSKPFHTTGRVYLAGPHGGAPLSLVFSTPAISGPYDLGNVVVRAAVHVDPTTARITVVSDPLPLILDGIPLRIRSLLVQLDRPGFTLNPTNCQSSRVLSTARGIEGGASTGAAHFQTTNCADLPFGPKLGLKLHGAKKRRGNPAVRAVVRSAPGEANIRRVVVAMPSTQLLDQSHIGTVCTRVQFTADQCPADSVYGRATVETPLFDQPLTGPVYLRTGSETLPNLVVDLHGQVDIELVGKIDTTRQKGLRTTFDAVPDAPFSKFVLDLEGGDKGLLVNSEHLCKGRKRASVRIIGQNGIRSVRKARLQAGCGKKRKRASRSHGSKRAVR